MRHITAATLAVVATFFLAAPAGAATKGDMPRTENTPDCISGREYRVMPSGKTIRELETWAGVRGEGQIVKTQRHGKWIIKQYRWCGHTRADGYFQISGTRRASGMYDAEYATWFDYTSAPLKDPDVYGRPNGV